MLREVGLNPTDPDDPFGSGFEDEADYARVHLPDLPDDALVELHDYVAGAGLREDVTWEAGYVNAFLSHLASEKDYVTSFNHA